MHNREYIGLTLFYFYTNLEDIIKILIFWKQKLFSGFVMSTRINWKTKFFLFISANTLKYVQFLDISHFYFSYGTSSEYFAY